MHVREAEFSSGYHGPHGEVGEKDPEAGCCCSKLDAVSEQMRQASCLKTKANTVIARKPMPSKGVLIGNSKSMMHDKNWNDYTLKLKHDKALEHLGWKK